MLSEHVCGNQAALSQDVCGIQAMLSQHVCKIQAALSLGGCGIQAMLSSCLAIRATGQTSIEGLSHGSLPTLWVASQCSVCRLSPPLKVRVSGFRLPVPVSALARYRVCIGKFLFCLSKTKEKLYHL